MATSHTQTNFHKLRDSPPSTHRSDVELSDFHAPENEPAEAQSLLEQGVISPALLLKKHSPANSSVAGSVIGSPASYIGEPPTRRQVLAWRFRFIVFCGLVIAATALTAVSLSETDRQWFYIDYPSMNVTTQYGWLRYQIVPIGSTIEVMRGEPSYLLEDKNGAIGSVGKAVAVLSLLTCIAAVCLSCSVEHHMRFGRSSCIGRTGIRLVEVACWFVTGVAGFAFFVFFYQEEIRTITQEGTKWGFGYAFIMLGVSSFLHLLAVFFFPLASKPGGNTRIGSAYLSWIFEVCGCLERS